MLELAHGMFIVPLTKGQSQERGERIFAKVSRKIDKRHKAMLRKREDEWFELKINTTNMIMWHCVKTLAPRVKAAVDDLAGWIAYRFYHVQGIQPGYARLLYDFTVAGNIYHLMITGNAMNIRIETWPLSAFRGMHFYITGADGVDRVSTHTPPAGRAELIMAMNEQEVSTITGYINSSTIWYVNLKYNNESMIRAVCSTILDNSLPGDRTPPRY